MSHERGSGEFGRVLSFSDAVFAIAIWLDPGRLRRRQVRLPGVALNTPAQMDADKKVPEGAVGFLGYRQPQRRRSYVPMASK